MKFDILTEDGDVTEGVYVKRVTGTVSPELIKLVKEAQKLLQTNNPMFKGILLNYSGATHNNFGMVIYEDEEGEEVNNHMTTSGHPDITVTLGGITVTETSKYNSADLFTFFVNI